jgi:hypothetical protein
MRVHLRRELRAVERGRFRHDHEPRREILPPLASRVGDGSDGLTSEEPRDRRPQRAESESQAGDGHNLGGRRR